MYVYILGSWRLSSFCIQMSKFVWIGVWIFTSTWRNAVQETIITRYIPKNSSPKNKIKLRERKQKSPSMLWCSDHEDRELEPSVAHLFEKDASQIHLWGCKERWDEIPESFLSGGAEEGMHSPGCCSWELLRTGAGGATGQSQRCCQWISAPSCCKGVGICNTCLFYHTNRDVSLFNATAILQLHLLVLGRRSTCRHTALPGKNVSVEEFQSIAMLPTSSACSCR